MTQTRTSLANAPLWSYGFRPFFLAAALVAPLLVACWLAALLAGHPLSPYFDPLTWHAHEMLFGFAGAMIAGFLLTAVPNWTGSQAVHGTPLAFLAVLWSLGRVLPLLTDSPLVTVVDLAFLPTLAAFLVPPLWKKRDRKSLVFIPILGGLWGANLLMHLQVLTDRPGLAAIGLKVALGLIITLIVIIGGRVIPFFTERALPHNANLQRRRVGIEAVAVLSALLLPAMDAMPSWLVATLCLVAALAHMVRMIGWCVPGVHAIPLLWVLYAGYAWIGVGFALKGLAALGLVAVTAATHAFTAGAMGVVGLGIMARASLGHTGRALQPSRLTVVSFHCAIAAAILRVAGPLLSWPARPVLIGSGWLWAIAFLSFLIVYIPILTRPRADA